MVKLPTATLVSAIAVLAAVAATPAAAKNPPNPVPATFADPPPTPNAPGAVPEPATWAMMLVGFGAMGLLLRSRRRAAA
jgi:hypothetical protein